MAFDDASDREGRSKGATSAHRQGAFVFAGATIAGLFFAAISMALTAFVVRLIADDQSPQLQIALVAAGTTVGACLGGWVAQPSLTRLADKVLARAKDDHLV